MPRNPLHAQQPAPPYANDPCGFFGAALAQSEIAGLASLLPAGNVSQSDVMVKARLLAGQIAWVPTKAIWKGCNLVVSLADAQFALLLEEGGDVPQGRLSVLALKLQFSSFGKGWPGSTDTFKVQAGGAWHQFTVSDVMGLNDDNEPGLMLFLDKDQGELGL